MRIYGTDSTAYVRVEPVYDLLVEVRGCSAAPLVANNTGHSVQDFVQMLVDFESKRGAAFRNGRRRLREAMKMTILLPEGFDLARSADLLGRYFKALYKTVTGHFAYAVKRGKGTYLVCYFSERPYYPAGTEQDVKARHDTYRNGTTGRLCRASDPDAVLAVSKGQTVRTEKVYFLNKNTALQTGDADAFERLMKYLKGLLVKVLRAMSCRIRDSIVLHKLNYSKCNKYQVRNVNKVNGAIVGIEKALNDLYDVLQGGYMLDSQSRQALCALIGKYRRYFKMESFRDSKQKLSLGRSVPYRVMDENLQSLKDLFANDQSKFIKKYIEGVTA